ncbi:MAG: GTP-binding protein [Acaryochloris sp. RU_4_1]|nr:GTP-binding protein [Acaryochloris sp. SU_5_25]NJM65537.1 GTP-binding protein [Acaryochloris sp. RU_4_1]NJR54385.1 GTP-binding protein [Acaryochloris sp. CRU_2_0]
MLQKKICMVGAFATGKTSLVARYVQGIYSDKYQTTVGVKIDKKKMTIASQDLNLILWDIHGEDEFQKIKLSYLRGSAAYILVADGTRRDTLCTVFNLQAKVEQTIGSVPFMTILNKYDLTTDWELDEDDLDQLSQRRWPYCVGSAKTGLGVEECFKQLVQ